MPLIPETSQFIPLDQAVAMTTLLRQNQEAILAPLFRGRKIIPTCETFNKEAFENLLNHTRCAGIRAYLGMDENMQIRMIFVAVDSNGQDLLPVSAVHFSDKKAMNTTDANEEDDDDYDILEDGQRCPDLCITGSPLNP